MTNLAISIENLGKMYRLYQNPGDKVIDAFGLNKLFFWRKKFCQEFWALRDLNLNIKKGERVGIIGRNGAGKSTLLKIIAGTVAPTEGVITVNGRIQALMELGTGFHPEFTGRQNIRSSLAYQGILERVAREKERQIIEFSELDDFIDQPVKTYSAGMYARLAFSTATAIEPEILIIDEVLGAGDAYFASKCFDKMKQITQDSGATVLFVSHDSSSIEMLCERAIWIERGTVKMQGMTHQVSKSYAQMIRERTNQRIKAKNSQASLNKQVPTAISQVPIQLVFRLTNLQKNIGIYASFLELKIGNVVYSSLDIGSPQDNSYEYDAFISIQPNSSYWGEPVKYDSNQGNNGRLISDDEIRPSVVVFNIRDPRQLLLGGINLAIRTNKNIEPQLKIELLVDQVFTKLGGIRLCGDDDEQTYLLEINIPPLLLHSIVATELSLTDFQNNTVLTVTEHEGALSSDRNNMKHAEIISPEEEQIRGNISEGKESFQYFSLSSLVSDNKAIDNLERPEIYDGSIAVREVIITNERGMPSGIFQTFEQMNIDIAYKVLGNTINADFVVCFHRLGVIAMQFVSSISNQNRRFILGENEEGVCSLHIPQLPLGRGTYLMSVGIFPPLDYNSLDTEKSAYVLHDRRYEIVVEQPEQVAFDLGMCRSLNSHWTQQTLNSEYTERFS